MLQQASRYWHTVKYLKPKQIFFRVWKKLYRPQPTLKPPPQPRVKSGVWITPIQTQPSLNGSDEFIFHGLSGRLEEIGWDGPEREKLWRYNQHYFSDLIAEGAPDRTRIHKDLMASWIAQNPPGIGNGWEPYPCSLRIVNWIKWSLNNNELGVEEHRSLGNQVRWLEKNIEWHILGNHLFANAKALIFAGLWFDGPEAQGWLEKGFHILSREIPEQILPDGGHFELSTMYHILATEDVLDLLNICACFPHSRSPTQRQSIEAMKACIPSMLHWLDTMCHPDGEIAFFNDAAFDIAPSPDQLFSYARQLDLDTTIAKNTTTMLANSGYARLENPSAVLLADMAPVGPDYLPGHAHADTLSFELSLNGKRLICNSGTSVYGTGAERLRQRSTAAHSTLAIDGENSSEVWGGFRVARRARVSGEKIADTANSLQAKASHDGYCRLPGSPVHHRSWTLEPNELCIHDQITGQGQHSVEIYFYITPQWQPTLDDDKIVSLTNSDGSQCRFTFSSSQIISIFIEPATWHPHFGKSDPNWRIRITLSGATPLSHKTLLRWNAS